jgi:hypothetical protein
VTDDIAPILRRWPWDPKNTVRRVTGEDGGERVQIRVFMSGYHGILQFECDSRPDGQRPYDFEFALDFFEARTRDDESFRLDEGQSKELFDEGMMVYQRYVILFQMGDYARVIRDTERNMRLFRFVNQWAEREEDRQFLERWWPYILRMHAVSSAMLSLADNQPTQAAECITQARAKIEALAELDDETFRNERERSLTVLSEVQKQIDERRPLTEIEVLERMRDRAIADENYELAARLRDQIAEMKDDTGTPQDGEPPAPP